MLVLLMAKTFRIGLRPREKKHPPFGGWRHHLAPAKAGALWVLGNVPHDTKGKRREAYSVP